MLQQEQCRSYLEIGARHGDTFYAVMKSLPRGSFGLAIDLPGGAWGTYSSKNALKRAIYRLKCEGVQDVAALLGDSQSGDIAKVVRKYGRFDAVLIDADHRYAGVKRDFELYSPQARIVALHDIAGEGQVQKTSGLPVEVPRLWRELREQWHDQAKRWLEIIDHQSESKMGIGVLWM